MPISGLSAGAGPNRSGEALEHYHALLFSRTKHFSLSPLSPLPTLASLHPLISVPLIFTTLLLTLWTYKCIMLVVFQNHIIYMPNMPPFSRRERMEDYVGEGKGAGRGVAWREERINAADGTELALAVGELGKGEESEGGKVEREGGEGDEGENRKRGNEESVIVYFHGNGGSIPPRLPSLSQVLKLMHERYRGEIDHTIVALSYRGFWTSKGRPSERGIRLDATGVLDWVAKEYPNASLTLWGQSIGAGVATAAAAAEAVSQGSTVIDKLILETPFTSVRDMLTALYPQRWLPYRYLYPFLWNQWDSRQALRQMAEQGRWPQVLIVSAENDELVPRDHGEQLESICRANELPVRRVVIRGALHHEVMSKAEGRRAIIS